MPETSFAEVAEGVRATLAAYAQALDDGRTDDVLRTYAVDGRLDVPGQPALEGHDALRQAYEGWAPQRPQRHLVANTLVTDWGAAEARATSDVVFLLKDEAWSVVLVARYHDELQRIDGSWRFRRRTIEYVR